MTHTGASHSDDDKILGSGYQFKDLNAFLHLERIKEGMSSNVAMPMVVDFNELIYETVKYSNMDLVINAGSYLVLFCLTVVLIFGCTGFLFVNIYIRELRELVHRKYVEDSYSNGIKRL